jgi:hypothetical protein
MSSPATVQVRAVQALKHSSHPALRHLQVEETDHSIIISGRVTSYYLKQLAQETIMPVRGELHLVNQVRVVKELS